jgi:hypothetical protein
MSHFSVPGQLFPSSALRQSGPLTPSSQPAAPPRQRCAPFIRRGDAANVRAQAKSKKTSPDPPDIPKDESRRQGGREWLQQLLSKFGPITEKAENTHVLDFEKPLVELDNRIKEVHSFCTLSVHHIVHCFPQQTFYVFQWDSLPLKHRIVCEVRLLVHVSAGSFKALKAQYT